MGKYLAVAEGSQIDASYGSQRRYPVLSTGEKREAQDHPARDVSETSSNVPNPQLLLSLRRLGGAPPHIYRAIAVVCT